MYYFEVALVKSARSSTKLLTYHYSEPIKSETLVKLKVRGKDELGVIVNKVSKPNFTTKPIDSITDIKLDEKLLRLAKWISQYYRAPLGACIRLLVPSGVDKKRRTGKENPQSRKSGKKLEPLTTDQERATKQLLSSNDTSLLYGVTGSGKTRVYIELAKKQIKQGRSVIVLVPEISLTTQLMLEFKFHFADVFTTHSHMTNSQRHKIWSQIYESTKPTVVVGPRSALFSPTKNLGLVIIDESHDDSYKQTNSPRYNALKVARKLCDLSSAKLILGSATPSITDYYLADQRGAIVKLPKPIKPHAGRQVSLIDMSNEKNATIFSKRSKQSIERALKNNEQVLVYHNRRGTAPLAICSECSWTPKCPTCHIPMVLHRDIASLKCHSCGRSDRLPSSCPECNNTDIVYRGFGTKKIVDELSSLFPKSKIARFDTDNKKSDSLAVNYSAVHSGKVDILVGTQILAKGLDLPKLSTGIVVSADTGLNIPDYRSNEISFQLLHQVIGRVGRHSTKSRVEIQTFSPDNPVIQFAIKQDYDSFYSWAVAERKISAYPPFRHLLLLTCAYASRAKAHQVSNDSANELREAIPRLEIVGPAPSIYERLGSKYRWQILVKSNSRSELLKADDLFADNPHWTIELDPVSLL